MAWNLRRSLQRRREELVAAFELEVEPTQYDQLSDHEALAFGCEVLSALPSQQRDIFLSYVVEEKPMTDIARAANCPLQTAYSRLHSARARICAAVKANPSRCAPPG
ncbi:MAG TPA: sigma-70 family RNA polymerase sigma factor [Polyangiales bacterium]|nr:sigma-70 family RNA polymerase sigma factor [Polyangiales bacterium]